MTSQKDRVQALINEIDAILVKASPRLPWVMSGDNAQQRQTLQKTRDYLVNLQRQMAAEEPRSPSMASGALAPRPAVDPSAPAENAQQVLQAVLQEMEYLRTNLIQPLRSEVEDLHHQRKRLSQEVQQLEAQRQQNTLPSSADNQQQVITEFLQALMNRLQESLTGQVTQTIANLQTQAIHQQTLLDSFSRETASGSPLLTPEQRLERLQALQSQSDQLLLRLDSTLSTVFESLQRNIQSYHESLGQGLDKMHSLGQQGEVMFTALVNHLAQQLGREASAYLGSSVEWSDELASESSRPARLASGADQGVTPQPQEVSAPHSEPIPEANQEPVEGTSAPNEPAPEFNLDTLDLNALELDPLDNADLDEPLLESADDLSPDLPESDLPDITDFEDDFVNDFEISEDEDKTFIQLDDVTADSMTMDLSSTAVDRLTSPEAIAATQPEQPAEPPEGLYRELDEFYESLFGPEEGQVTSPQERVIPTSDQEIESITAEAAVEPTAVAEDVAENVNVAEQFSESFLENASDPAIAASFDDLPFPEIAELPQPSESQAFEFESGLEFESNTANEFPGQLLDQNSAAFAEAIAQMEPIADVYAAEPDLEVLSEPEPIRPEADLTPAPPEPDDFDLAFEEPNPALILEESLRLDFPEEFEVDQGAAAEPTSDDGIELSEPPDTIESLSDLIGDASTDQPQTPPVSELDFPPTLPSEFDDPELAAAPEDTFIAAAPEEDLLAEDLPETQPDFDDLNLDANTLQQLSEDLSNLEGFGEEASLSSLADDLEPRDRPSPTELEPDPPSVAETSSPPAAVPETNLEPFGDPIEAVDSFEQVLDNFLDAPLPDQATGYESAIVQPDQTVGPPPFPEFEEPSPAETPSPLEMEIISGDSTGLTLDDLAIDLPDEPSRPDPEALGFSSANMADTLEDLFADLEADLDVGLSEPNRSADVDSPTFTDRSADPEIAPSALEPNNQPASEVDPLTGENSSAFVAADDEDPLTIQVLEQLFGNDFDSEPEPNPAVAPSPPTPEPDLDRTPPDVKTQNLTLENAFESFPEGSELSAEEEAEKKKNEEVAGALAEQQPEAAIATPSTSSESVAEADLDVLSARDRQTPVIEPASETAEAALIAPPETVVSQAIDSPTATDQPTQPPSPEFPEADLNDPTARDQAWYLGLDIGTTGLSAVLFNSTTGQLHPIYWTQGAAPVGDRTGSETLRQRYFRLPMAVYQIAQAEGSERLVPVGVELETVLPEISVLQGVEPTVSGTAHYLLRDFKPFLKLGIPYHDPDLDGGMPILQWSDQQQIPLESLQQGLQTLLSTLGSTTPLSSSTSLTSGAVDLSPATLLTALQVLQGVMVSYPANWPDTYSFNLREAILANQFVADPAQIFFMEDAIAAFLSALPDPNSPDANPLEVVHNRLPNTVQPGITLVLSAGASLTEFGLVDLPEALHELMYQDFALRSFPYAGHAIDQDIVCALLYPKGNERLQQPADEPALPASGRSQAWDWQLAFQDTASAAWNALGLDQLELPRRGELDANQRTLLRQRLNSTILGRSLLEAARHLKRMLQHQEQFTIALANRVWTITRQELESQILYPYIQQLNNQLNILLSQTGVPSQGVRQVICTGGTASFPVMARWLRQKLPNATIIQDTYTDNRPPACSRIAYGLVNLARYPHVLNLARQQYNDYFLLLELLRSFPNQALPVNHIMQRLERRGINTQACYLHVLALLEGHLPPGLMPTPADSRAIFLRQESVERYQELRKSPLFHKQGGQMYVPNPAQYQRLKEHLSMVLADKHQSLTEPLIAHLGFV